MHTPVKRNPAQMIDDASIKERHMSIKDNFRQAFNEVMQDGKNEQNTEAPAEANDAKAPDAREMSAGQPRKPK